MRLIACLLCLWFGSSILSAQVKNFEVRRQQGVDLRLEGLEKHSQWLYDQKLLGTRLGVLALIIELDPGNVSARKSLGYKSDKKGGWIDPKRPKRSKDKNPAGLKLEPTHREKSQQAFLDYHLALLEEAKTDPEQRDQLAADILRVAPDHEGMHVILEELRTEEGWLPREVVIGRERRKQMAKALAQARRSPGIQGALNPIEEDFGLPWKGVIESSVGRICGTVKLNELETCAKQLQGLMVLYQMMFDPAAEVPLEFGVFLMKSEKEGKLFLKGLDDLDDEQRKLIVKQRGLYHGMTKKVGHWSTQYEERYDGVARMLASQVFGKSMGVDLGTPWLHEGFGMYLCFQVTGTHTTWYLPCLNEEGWESKESLRNEMLLAKDWRLLGARFLDQAMRPKVAEIVTAKSNTFSAGDLLYSYLLAAYISEAFPKDVQALIREVTDGENPIGVLKRRLGMSPEEVDWRLQIWLRHYAEEHGDQQDEEG